MNTFESSMVGRIFWNIAALVKGRSDSLWSFQLLIQRHNILHCTGLYFMEEHKNWDCISQVDMFYSAKLWFPKEKYYVKHHLISYDNIQRSDLCIIIWSLICLPSNGLIKKQIYAINSVANQYFPSLAIGERTIKFVWSDLITYFDDFHIFRWFSPPSSVMTTTIVSGPAPSGLKTRRETRYWVNTESSSRVWLWRKYLKIMWFWFGLKFGQFKQCLTSD